MCFISKGFTESKGYDPVLAIVLNRYGIRAIQIVFLVTILSHKSL